MPRRNHPHTPPRRALGRDRKLAQEEGDRAYRQALQRARNARSTQHIALNRVRVGDIVMARIAFHDAPDYKVRPCIVVRLAASGMATLWPCTSQLRHRHRPGYVPLPSLPHHGLPRPSLVRIGHEIQVPIDDIVDVRGPLDPMDLRRLRLSKPCDDGRPHPG